MKFMQNLRMLIIVTFFTYTMLSTLSLCYSILSRSTGELLVQGIVAFVLAVAAIDVFGKWTK
jgi:hypothetical protein